MYLINGRVCTVGIRHKYNTSYLTLCRKIAYSKGEREMARTSVFFGILFVIFFTSDSLIRTLVYDFDLHWTPVKGDFQTLIGEAVITELNSKSYGNLNAIKREVGHQMKRA